MLIGYARVSTKHQGDSLDTQCQTPEDYGCEKVFTDTISGAKSARPGLDEALGYMRDSDALVVTRFDRLGRTALDTLRTISGLEERSIPVVMLDPKLDTRTKESKLMKFHEWPRRVGA